MKAGFVSLGLDLSVTGTGYVLLTLNELGTVDVTLSKVIKGDRMLKGLPRAIVISQEILGLIACCVPDVIVIEGYAFGNAHTLATLVELGTVVRYDLMKKRMTYSEIAPTKLKKFVCGSGAAKKELMLKAVYQRWGFDTDDNNTADAFALAQVGMALTGAVRISAADKKILGLSP